MDVLPALVESTRLTLRQWTDDDAAPLSAAIEVSLTHLRPWMPWAVGEPSTREDRLARIRRWRAEWEQGGDSVFGIFLDHIVIGGAGLHRRVGPAAVEIGYWIHVDYVRNGYATEAAEALTGAAFDIPSIDRVEIHHDKANTASAGVPRRLGFTLADETPDEVESPGGIGVECRWVITRSAWTQSRPPLQDRPLVRVVAGLLRRDGQLLLCHRHPDRVDYPNVWDLPGGHINPNESMAEALVRELDEVFGIQIQSPAQLPWETMQVDGVELNVFLIDGWDEEPQNTAPDEHDDIRWVGPDDIEQLDLAHPSYAQLLGRALE
jgi:RimJ/RimL family protein N-acetyltransferase/8-oxo-dGTP pyrophosphatase MutT (NUDIX family)